MVKYPERGGGGIAYTDRTGPMSSGAKCYTTVRSMTMTLRGDTFSGHKKILHLEAVTSGIRGNVGGKCRF